MLQRWLLTALVITVPGAVPSVALENFEHSPQFLVHLLGYIAADYAGAVRNGKVIEDFEYQEQRELVAAAQEIVPDLPEVKRASDIGAALTQLKEAIDQKAEPAIVSELAQTICTRVVDVAKLNVTPQEWPDLHRGKQLFAESCATCHGNRGNGDGDLGKRLDPKPTDFHGKKMSTLKPFQIFNTIRLGVPGTSMAAFPSISQRDLWNLAFYVLSLRHGDIREMSEKLPVRLSLDEVASRSDDALEGLILHRLGKTNLAPKEIVSAVRTTVPEGLRPDFFQKTRDGLEKAYGLYVEGKVSAARQAAITAYLEGFEPIEPKLRARQPDRTLRIEELMAAVRAGMEKKEPAPTIRDRMDQVRASLNEAERIVENAPNSAWLTFTVSAGIFVREAFEAVLLIVTLLGILRGLGNRKALAFLHGGWVAAIACGIGLWFASGWLITVSGLGRELLEGIVGALAVAILLYLGFWLHQKSEIGRWTAFVKDNAAKALSGRRLFFIAGVSFMAVFREAFETVLFMRAIALEMKNGELPMALGVLTALAVVILLAFVLIRYSRRIPLNRLFALSSWILLVLAFIVAGKAIHSFQEAGLLSITSVARWLSVPLLGIFPTIESLAGQCVVVAVAGTIGWRSS